MEFPILSELPAPPSGRTGWPWTEQSAPTSALTPSGRTWPRVSIVTPSYNYASFIEETIRSVLLQGYPNLEYIIIDGGSTDHSLEIIRKYEKWLAYWVSEPDQGQSDAVNKGWGRATGEYLAYLNSDDTYLPHAVTSALSQLLQYPSVGMLHGDSHFVDEKGCIIRTHRGRNMTFEEVLCWSAYISQPTVFLPKHSIVQVGMLDASMHYAMDFDLWLRVRSRFEIQYVSQLFANERHHLRAKTTASPCKSIEGQIYAVERFVIDGDHESNAVALKRRALATHFVNMANCCYGAGRSVEAREFAWKALKHSGSAALAARGVFILIVATLFSGRVGGWLRKARRRLRKKLLRQAQHRCLLS
jgi:GT2 family glycosyltransferase